MKKLTSLLLGLVVVPSVAFVGCGKKDNDKNNSDPLAAVKESLAWIKEDDDLRLVFNAAKYNYTLTAKDIDFTVKTSQDEYGDDVYNIENVTYGDVLYKILIEDDAVLFDAGDKKQAVNKNDDKFYSYGSELALSGTKLKQYNYKMTQDGWVVNEVEDITEGGAISSGKKTITDAKDEITDDIYFGAGWHRAFSSIYASEKEIIDEVASWYDSSSGTFKVPNDFYDTIDDNVYYNTITTSGKYRALNGFKYLDYDSNYEGYKELVFEKLSMLNVEFKLDGQKLVGLSYDVYMTDGRAPSSARYDSNFTDGKYAGLHVELTNLGTTKLVVGDNLQASREGYTGVEANALQLKAARTFYNGGNYTVSYIAKFSDYNQYGFGNVDPEYEHILKVTATSASEYLKYYDKDLGCIRIKHWMDIKVDETNYVHYEYDHTLDKWWKYNRKVAEGQTTDEMFESYKSFYWNTEENSLGGVLDIDDAYIKGKEDDYVVWSDTLNCYILNVKSTSNSASGEDTLKLTSPYDAIYSFDSNGLKFYASRLRAKYIPATNIYANNVYVDKTINDIGTTVIEAPTEFEAAN